jgi:hypothetical protein
MNQPPTLPLVDLEEEISPRVVQDELSRSAFVFLDGQSAESVTVSSAVCIKGLGSIREWAPCGLSDEDTTLHLVSEGNKKSQEIRWNEVRSLRAKYIVDVIVAVRTRLAAADLADKIGDFGAPLESKMNPSSSTLAHKVSIF